MRTWTVTLVLLLAVAAPVVAGVRDVEWRIKDIEWQVRNAGGRSYASRYGNGNINVKYVVEGERRAYVAFDRYGVKVREWLRRPGGILRYESYYGAGLVKERLLEDDRIVSYNSFYKSGQKKEEYHYNKYKKVRAFYEYDKNGKLVRP